MVTAAKVRTEFVAEGMGTPALRHWMSSGRLPVTAIVSEAGAPTFTCWLCGSLVMIGGSAVMVRTATVLVIEPHAFVITTSKLPASLVAAGLKFKAAAVAPPMGEPFLRHWKPGAVPVAMTVKLALNPALTVTFVGWEEIAGALQPLHGAGVVLELRPVGVAKTKSFVLLSVSWQPLARR